MSLISVSTHAKPTYYVAHGQHFSTEADARAYNAEVAFNKVIGKALANRVMFCTFQRSILRALPLADHANLAKVCREFLNAHHPAIMALEGRFGWVGGKRRTIDLPDGMGYDSKAEASAKMLELLIEDMSRTQFGVHQWVRRQHPTGLGQPQLSALGVLALCNVTVFRGDDVSAKLADKSRVSSSHAMSHIRDFFKHRDIQGDVKFANAVIASYEERTSTDPVPTA